jgi:hypothetical protein
MRLKKSFTLLSHPPLLLFSFSSLLSPTQASSTPKPNPKKEKKKTTLCNHNKPLEMAT